MKIELLRKTLGFLLEKPESYSWNFLKARLNVLCKETNTNIWFIGKDFEKEGYKKSEVVDIINLILS